MPKGTKIPPEFGRKMVELYRSGRTPTELAREFVVSTRAILNWVKQADLDEGRRSDGLSSSDHDELRRLQRENKALREDREILKRAIAWFAQETSSKRSGSSNS